MSARQVRRFQLERDVDVSGVSGTGTVAFGAQAPDGTCVLWWASGLESTTIYPNMETLLAIHGHGGMTRAVYIDPDLRDLARGVAGDGGGDAAGRVARGGQLLDEPAADHEADAAEPDPQDEPAHALARATSRAAGRAGARQPAARPATRAVRSPTRSS